MPPPCAASRSIATLTFHHGSHKLYPRRWSRPPAAEEPQGPGFTVLSWNVWQAGSSQFSTRRNALNAGRQLAWAARSRLHLAEIRRANADIVCLCECNLFEEWWVPEMRGAGYCVAARICSGAPYTPSYKAKDRPSGAAIFVRNSRFCKLRDFSRVLQRNREASGQRPMAAVVLRDVVAGRDLCVAVAHLFPPNRASDKVRTAEMVEIQELLNREVGSDVAEAQGDHKMAVVLCGDWNSPPCVLLLMVYCYSAQRSICGC